ncbi:hypothetical protein PENTCL1PPCAC_10603, partial [Pristionchus entomophagus]
SSPLVSQYAIHPGCVLGDAADHARLHHGLRPDYGSRATRLRHALPSLLQLGADHEARTDLAIAHFLLLLWLFRLLLRLQYDLQLSVLSHAGGGLVPRQTSRFRVHVHTRSTVHDDLSHLRAHALPRTGLHDHAGVCVGETQPSHPDELLPRALLPRPLSALGVAPLQSPARKQRPRRLPRNRVRSHVLLPGGRLPPAGGRYAHSGDTHHPGVSLRREGTRTDRRGGETGGIRLG